MSRGLEFVVISRIRSISSKVLLSLCHVEPHNGTNSQKPSKINGSGIFNLILPTNCPPIQPGRGATRRAQGNPQAGQSPPQPANAGTTSSSRSQARNLAQPRCCWHIRSLGLRRLGAFTFFGPYRASAEAPLFFQKRGRGPREVR